MENDKFFRQIITIGSIIGILFAIDLGLSGRVHVSQASFLDTLLKPFASLNIKPATSDSPAPAADTTPGDNPNYQPATTEEAAVINVVKNASPAVVSIVASQDLTIIDRGQYSPYQDLCGDPFFQQFLGDQCGQSSTPPNQHTQTQQVSAGTGFFINSNGLILTNKHVVDVSGAAFTVITNDGKKYPATIIAKDPVQDLALLKVNGTFPHLTLGNSDDLQVGQTVIAIGNALGQFTNSVSKGVVSGLSRSVTASSGGSSEQLSSVIQTDAAINPGNSGGPLLNLKGEVIGVDTAIAEGAQNIGFALPINQAKNDINQVQTGGKISYPFLGIRYVMVDQDIQQSNNLPVDYGALIVRGQSRTDLAVSPGSPADKAGIKENDIILEINGVKLSGNNDLATIIQKYKPGDMVTLTILSRGQQRNVTVTLAEKTS